MGKYLDRMDKYGLQSGVSQFQAKPADLTETDYANAIAQGQNQQGVGFDRAIATGDQQAALAQALMAQANGQGPSLANLQLQQATNQAANQAAGAIASQRGMNPAQQARLILQNQAAVNQQAAGQSAMLRMQEQLAAREQLGNVLANQRQGDLGLSAAGSGMFGTAGQLQNGQNTARIQNAGMAQGINAQTANANADRWNQARQTEVQIEAGQSAANKQMAGQMVGGVLGGAGGAITKLAGFASGGPVVPGHAVVRGDSARNDVVPALLSPGEIVIPRTVAQSDDAPERAAQFVAAIKKQKEPKGEPGGYGEVLQLQRDNAERLARLERMFLGGSV